MNVNTPKLTLGWREWLTLPDLSLPKIKAKVDTGARTSALHTFQIETFHQHGNKHVRFWVHPWQKRDDIVVVCSAPILDERVVTDSGGHREQRYVIETVIQLGDMIWSIELTLTNRDTMLFRMLLGRTALIPHWVVDSQVSYQWGRPSFNPYTQEPIKYRKNDENLHIDS